MSWLSPTPVEAAKWVEAQLVRPWSLKAGFTCLCCGAGAPSSGTIRHTQTCAVGVLLAATRTGDGLYTRTDGEVRGMVWDAINAPMGVVPPSCEEVYAEILRAEGREA